MDGEVRIYTPDEMMMLGMKCLVDNFGLINAEQFVNSVRAACPDYTLWRRQMFDDMSVDEVFKMVDEDVDNPFERGSTSSDTDSLGALRFSRLSDCRLRLREGEVREFFEFEAGIPPLSCRTRLLIMKDIRRSNVLGAPG